MEQYRLLLGVLQKQRNVANELLRQVHMLDLSVYENRYVFALKTQQLYTVMEDLMKATANTFENNISDQAAFHRELLKVLTTEVPGIRPPLFTEDSSRLLDKLRSFRHFIRHGYDYELDADELQLIQNRLQASFHVVDSDLGTFETYLHQLVGTDG